MKLHHGDLRPFVDDHIDGAVRAYRYLTGQPSFCITELPLIEGFSKCDRCSRVILLKIARNSSEKVEMTIGSGGNISGKSENKRGWTKKTTVTYYGTMLFLTDGKTIGVLPFANEAEYYAAMAFSQSISGRALRVGQTCLLVEPRVSGFWLQNQDSADDNSSLSTRIMPVYTVRRESLIRPLVPVKFSWTSFKATTADFVAGSFQIQNVSIQSPQFISGLCRGFLCDRSSEECVCLEKSSSASSVALNCVLDFSDNATQIPMAPYQSYQGFTLMEDFVVNQILLNMSLDSLIADPIHRSTLVDRLNALVDAANNEGGWQILYWKKVSFNKDLQIVHTDDYHVVQLMPLLTETNPEALKALQSDFPMVEIPTSNMGGPDINLNPARKKRCLEME
ncbi:MAG: hypothetical protein KVP17_001358 [Porospora cf. gigantea B]|uniref:uncharacterized protein n=1 Tax=Porospora cf. gigantea B TaxID=2853592 RepID=UPI003571E450|nr:MAG: hypothetical protein KVP17_001358 [Porospora cf. gigantea B]